jgi:hypothetical protein
MAEEEHRDGPLRGWRLWLLGMNLVIAGAAAALIAALKEPPQSWEELVWLRLVPPFTLLLAGSLLLVFDAARSWNERE